MLMQQKTSCDAMIDEKNKLINDFQQVNYVIICPLANSADYLFFFLFFDNRDTCHADFLLMGLFVRKFKL